MSKIPGFRSGKAWKKLIATIGYLIIALIVVGIFSDKDKPTTATSPVTSSVSTPSSTPEATPTTAPAPSTTPVATPTPTPTVTPSATPVPTPSPAPTPAPAPTPTAKTYKAGMYKIGSDMPAGEYVLVASGSMSYFEIDKDSEGKLESILANDTFHVRSIVTVANGQYIKLTGCIAYPFKDAPKVQLADGFLSDGMYKVGVDLPAGEYKVIPEGSMSYKEVSKDSSHTLNSIISNDILQGEGYSTIKNGQYLKLVGAKIKVQ